MKKALTYFIVFALLLSLAAACTPSQGLENSQGTEATPKTTEDVITTEAPEPTAPPATDAPVTKEPEITVDPALAEDLWNVLERIGEVHDLDLDRAKMIIDIRPTSVDAWIPGSGGKCGIGVEVFGSAAQGFAVTEDTVRYARVLPPENEELLRETEEYNAFISTAITVTAEDIAAHGCSAADGGEYLDAVGECFAEKLAKLFEDADEAFYAKCREAKLNFAVRNPNEDGVYFISIATRPVDLQGVWLYSDYQDIFNNGSVHPEFYGWFDLCGEVRLQRQQDGSWTGLAGFTASSPAWYDELG